MESVLHHFVRSEGNSYRRAQAFPVLEPCNVMKGLLLNLLCQNFSNMLTVLGSIRSLSRCFFLKTSDHEPVVSG